MARTVVLEHTLRTGERHFDWLFERPDEPDGPLVSFRLAVRVDRVGDSGEGVEPIEAVRMKDHRRMYLTYEGPLSEGRGDVSRVGEGEVAWYEERDGWIGLGVRWTEGGKGVTATWSLRHRDGDMWDLASKGA